MPRDGPEAEGGFIALSLFQQRASVSLRTAPWSISIDCHYGFEWEIYRYDGNVQGEVECNQYGSFFTRTLKGNWLR
jgi:hypothetical protein